MKNLLTLATLLTTASLFGCASTSTAPVTYMENQSEAYNIAHAGGLVTDIEDTKVPADKVGSITESMLKVGFVGAGYVNPQLGMTNWQTAGVNLLDEMLQPDSHGARNSLMAWMPLSEAGSTEDAQTRLLSHVKVSITAAMDEVGASYETIFDKDGKLVIQFIKSEWNCPEYVSGKTELDDLCRVRAQIFEPRKATSPAFIAGTQEQRYIFSSGHGRKYQSLNLLISDNSTVPEDEIYATISKNLPEWTYLYFAPGKVSMDNGETIDFPYILNNGEAKVFVIPEA